MVDWQRFLIFTEMKRISEKETFDIYCSKHQKKKRGENLLTVWCKRPFKQTLLIAFKMFLFWWFTSITRVCQTFFDGSLLLQGYVRPFFRIETSFQFLHCESQNKNANYLLFGRFVFTTTVSEFSFINCMPVRDFSPPFLHSFSASWKELALSFSLYSPSHSEFWLIDTPLLEFWLVDALLFEYWLVDILLFEYWLVDTLLFEYWLVDSLLFEYWLVDSLFFECWLVMGWV